MKYKKLRIYGYEGCYLIYENGSIYSLRKSRFIRPSVNIPGYYMVYLTKKEGGKGKSFTIGSLVLSHFVERKPSKKHECHHKDFNKSNNHYNNLEWCTHAENILRSRQEGYWKKSYVWLGKSRSEETRAKMAMAKQKPIKAISNIETLRFNSIAELLEHFNIYRKKFERIMRSNKTLNGYSIEYYNL